MMPDCDPEEEGSIVLPAIAEDKVYMNELNRSRPEHVNQCPQIRASQKYHLKEHAFSKKVDTVSIPRSIILDMAIVIRKQGGRWEKTDKVVFADEAQLQKLLYESPERQSSRGTVKFGER